jgi:hypothetical protein
MPVDNEKNLARGQKMEMREGRRTASQTEGLSATAPDETHPQRAIVTDTVTGVQRERLITASVVSLCTCLVVTRGRIDVNKDCPFHGELAPLVSPLVQCTWPFSWEAARQKNYWRIEMTHEEMKQAAIDCLAKAFKGEDVPAHVVQAATAIVLSPPPTQTPS